MNAAPEAAPLYFLHIPKTAGTSFMALLDAHYPPDRICPAYLWRDLLAIPPEQRRGYLLYHGHFYAYLSRAIGRPLQTITFLRDPVERSLSHYAHVLREPFHYLHHYARRHGSLLAFLRDPLTSPLITNFQTRALAVDLDPLVIAAALPQQALDALVLERLLETMTPGAVSDGELLWRARRQLDACRFVGLTEHYDESVRRLGALLGWEDQTARPVLNVAQERLRRDELDPETLAELRRHTALDQQLYDSVAQRYASPPAERAQPDRWFGPLSRIGARLRGSRR